MRINSKLLKEIEKYSSDLIINESSDNLSYHTLEHTQLVVENAKIIAKEENLNEDDIFILLTSAWFHDTGYIRKYIGHEEESVALAINYLKSKDIDNDILDKVSENILATTFPHNPTTKTAEILCDADMIHLGMPNYFEQAEKLRQELAKSGVRKLKKREFEEESILLFNTQCFYTNFCKTEAKTIKEANLKLLKASLQKKQDKKKTATEVSGKYSRGVDSMFKLTARNQINLSSIADNKSNILISLNGIIISMGLVAIASKFKEEPAIIIPSVIFIVFSLSTIILAILSTRPNISTGNISESERIMKNKNLLFFGNFYKMKFDDYELAIRELINNDRDLYSTMTMDQYFLGKVLAKKYKLLRWAYNVFMVGLVVSVIAFLMVFLQL